MPSLPPVSAKVIADAEQFIAEFKRAENQSARSAANIDREVGALTKNIAKKFTLGDVTKDLLKGAGLFGGFEIANTASDLLVGHFREAAELAKDIETATSRQLDLTKQIIALHQTDAQKVAGLAEELAAAQRAYEASLKPKVFTSANFLGMKIDTLPTTVARTAEDAKKSADLLTAVKEAQLAYEALNKKERDAFQPLIDNAEAYRLEIEKIQRLVALGPKQLGLSEDQGQSAMIAAGQKHFAGRIADEKSDQDRYINSLTAGLKNQESAFDDLIKKQREKTAVDVKTREEAEKLAEQFKELADPTLKFIKQIDELNASMAKLTPEQYNRAMAAIKDSMAADEITRTNKALDQFYGEIDDLSKLHTGGTNELAKGAHELGLAFSSAFEDAVIGGEKFSDVLRGLEKDLLRLYLRKNVTEKLFDSAGSLFTGAGALAGIGTFFGFAAGGADVGAGDFGIVGEKGPELFVPKSAGSIIPNAQSAAILSGDGGGITIHMPMTFSAGVQRQELEPMLGVWGKAIVSEVANKMQRGGGYRRAFA